MTCCCWQVSVSCSVYLKILFLMLFNFQPAKDTVLFSLQRTLFFKSYFGLFLSKVWMEHCLNSCLHIHLETRVSPEPENCLTPLMSWPLLCISHIFHFPRCTHKWRALEGERFSWGVTSHLLSHFNSMCLLDWPFQEVPCSMFLVEHWSSSTICPASWLALVTFT